MTDKNNILGYLFSTSSRFFKRAINQEVEKYDLTITQCGVIRTLLHGGDMTQAEIADLFSSDRATIGNVIQKLQEKGYLEKKINSKDRRAYVVSLTPKAREIAGEIDQISEKISSKAMEGLSQEEIQLFYKALNTMIRNLGGSDQKGEKL